MSDEPATEGEDREDEAQDGFEAELRAEIQEDLEERLETEDAPDEDQDDDAFVVMRPFPGTGASNPIVGGGLMIGAFEEGVDDLTGYLVPELPGEELLVVEGPRPGAARPLILGLAALLFFTPCLAVAFGLQGHFPTGLSQMVEVTVIGTGVVGLILAAIAVNDSLYDSGRVTCTSEGLGIQTGAVANWVPWSEVFELRSTQGEFSFLATAEEGAELIEILDRRGVERG
jgi:hypothetical protein